MNSSDLTFRGVDRSALAAVRRGLLVAIESQTAEARWLRREAKGLDSSFKSLVGRDNNRWLADAPFAKMWTFLNQTFEK
jgi:hypothetical protein